jgi:hypothetical protein
LGGSHRTTKKKAQGRFSFHLQRRNEHQPSAKKLSIGILFSSFVSRGRTISFSVGEVRIR